MRFPARQLLFGVHSPVKTGPMSITGLESEGER
jgi:hypothetical protein